MLLKKLLVGRTGNFQHGEERFLRDIDAAYALHAFFSFFLFLEQFAFPRDVSAVAFGEHVLADRGDGFAGDHAAADGGLDRDFKHLAGDQLAQARDEFAPALVGKFAVANQRQRVDRLAGDQNVVGSPGTELEFAL